MKKIKIYLLLTIFTPLIFINITKPVKAGVKWERTTVNRYNLSPTESVNVSAFVSGYLFTLKGLTSPWAEVEFYSTEGNINVTTLADDQGVFYFKSILAPQQTGDFCFLSYDTEGVANNPLCFSPPPPKTRTVIDDIVLSPTLSLDQGLFRQGKTIEAEGKTFPQAEVRIYMFEENRPFLLDLIDVIIPKAFARTGPRLIVEADAKGNFSFNLPTQKSSLWRMFAGPKFKNENMTAKSNTLEFSALSWLEWIIYQIFRFLYNLQKWLFKLLTNWKVIFGLLILAIGIIWKKIRSTKSQIRNKS